MQKRCQTTCRILLCNDLHTVFEKQARSFEASHLINSKSRLCSKNIQSCKHPAGGPAWHSLDKVSIERSTCASYKSCQPQTCRLCSQLPAALLDSQHSLHRASPAWWHLTPRLLSSCLEMPTLACRIQ